MPSLGPSSHRLFPEVPHKVLARPDAEEYVVIRLLAEGDSKDLRSFLSSRSEDSVRRAFLRRSRQLSRRDRAFWSLVLATTPRGVVPLAEEIWPL